MKIVFIITGLQTGGAEMMLLKLLERLDSASFTPLVISLTTEGDLGPRIRELGIPVHAMAMSPGSFFPTALWRLSRLLRTTAADVVQTWMYHADLIGGLAARLARVPTVVWGIRNTNLDLDKTKPMTRRVVRLCALLSGSLPSGILSCSEAARALHIARGYAADKIAVIPNGFDIKRFRPDAAARSSVRSELGLAPNTPLVGIVGRQDPLKNHAGFLTAAGLLSRSRPDVHFVLVGRGLDRENIDLLGAAHEAGVSDRTHWLGQRSDIPRLMAAFDVLASSSFGEAFPNVLGEAMACGVPCVVTDVGDSAVIVGETGVVVRSGDMEGLAAALEDLLAEVPEARAGRAASARQRVQQRFEIEQIARLYEAYYQQFAKIR